MRVLCSRMDLMSYNTSFIPQQPVFSVGIHFSSCSRWWLVVPPQFRVQVSGGWNSPSRAGWRRGSWWSRPSSLYVLELVPDVTHHFPSIQFLGFRKVEFGFICYIGVGILYFLQLHVREDVIGVLQFDRISCIEGIPKYFTSTCTNRYKYRQSRFN